METERGTQIPRHIAAAPGVSISIVGLVDVCLSLLMARRERPAYSIVDLEAGVGAGDDGNCHAWN
jgi:hypothetical protein